MSITHEEHTPTVHRLPRDSIRQAPIKESMSSIFQKNAKPLKHYISRFFSSSHDVEDVLHDVFIRVMEAERYMPIEMPKAFIYKVAKHLALNEKSKACNTLNTFMEAEEFEKISTSIELEDLIEQEQRFEHFCTSVNKLPPQCKKVFIMKKVHGLSNGDIAQQLNISIGTVDKHLATGLIDCKNDLQRMGHLQEVRHKNIAVNEYQKTTSDSYVIAAVNKNNVMADLDYSCK